MGRGAGRHSTACSCVASLVAVGGIAFGIGRATAASPTATATGRFANGQGNAGGVAPNGSFAPGRGQFGQGGGFGGFGGAGASIALQGTVVSVTADTLTLKTTGGQTVEIPLATSTTFGTETASDAAAVTTGANVLVQLQGGGRGAFGGNGNGGQGRQVARRPAPVPPGRESHAPGASGAPRTAPGFNLGTRGERDRPALIAVDGTAPVADLMAGRSRVSWFGAG